MSDVKRAAAVVVCVALLAACAGGDDSASSPTTGDLVPAEGTFSTGSGDLVPAEEVWPAFDDFRAATATVDVDAVSDFYTDDVVSIDCWGTETRGRDEYELWIQGSLALVPDGRFEVQDRGIVAGDFIMVVFVWSGTNPTSGERFEVIIPTILQLRDGRISRQVGLCNLEDFPT